MGLEVDPSVPLCVRCLASAQRDIADLELDYRDLGDALGVAGGGGGGRTTDRHSTPLRLEVDALMREIFWQLTVWEPAVREAARLGPESSGNVRMSWAVATALAVIVPRVDVLAALPLTWCYADGWSAGPVPRTGVDAVVALQALHRRARSMLGTSTLVMRLPGDCSACGSLALQRIAGSDTVSCAVCERSWAYDDYRRYVRLILAAASKK